MFDIYVRVSEVAGREGDSFGSPEEQEAAARAWAEREGFEVGEVVTELDVSGGVRADDRDLGRLIAKIEAGESDGLIVRYIDRFGRDMIENALAHDRIVAAGGRLVATASGYDSANLTPDTRMVFNIQSAIAQAQREKNRDARLQGSRRAVARGVYLAPCAPFGYLRREQVDLECWLDGIVGTVERGRHGEPIISGGSLAKRDGVLVLDPVRSKLLPGIFEKRAEGWTLAAIREWLAEEGVQVTAEGIRSIIKNRAYLGESKKPTAAKGRPEVIKNAHPPLVSEDLWERANAVSNGRDCRNTGRLANQVRLSGLVYCATCGRKLKTGGGGHAGEPRYTCTAADCPQRAVIKSIDLDVWVRDVLGGALLHGEKHVAAVMEGDDRYERALDAVKEAAAERDHWRDQVSVLKTGEDNWTRGLEAREAALAESRKALRAIPAPRAARGKRDTTPVSFEEALPHLDREHIGRFVSRVVVRPVGRGRRVPAGERAEVWFVGAEEPVAGYGTFKDGAWREWTAEEVAFSESMHASAAEWHARERARERQERAA